MPSTRERFFESAIDPQRYGAAGELPAPCVSREAARGQPRRGGAIREAVGVDLRSIRIGLHSCQLFVALRTFVIEGPIPR